MKLTWTIPGVVEDSDEGSVKQLNSTEVNMEKKYPPREGTPLPPQSARELKCHKKKTTPKKYKKVTEEAASKTEDRWAQ